jgi:hypothetical protein
MQEVKPQLFVIGNSRGFWNNLLWWTDGWMDGWKHNSTWGKWTWTKHDMHRQNSYSIPDPRAPSGGLSQNPKRCFSTQVKSLWPLIYVGVRRWSHPDLGVGFRSQVANLSSSEIYDLGSENTHTHTHTTYVKFQNTEKKSTKQQWRSSNVHTTHTTS